MDIQVAVEELDVQPQIQGHDVIQQLIVEDQVRMGQVQINIHGTIDAVKWRINTTSCILAQLGELQLDIGQQRNRMIQGDIPLGCPFIAQFQVIFQIDTG